MLQLDYFFDVIPDGRAFRQKSVENGLANVLTVNKRRLINQFPVTRREGRHEKKRRNVEEEEEGRWKLLNYNTPTKFEIIIVINRRTDLRSYRFVAGVHDLHASNGEDRFFARVHARAKLSRTHVRTHIRDHRPTV